MVGQLYNSALSVRKHLGVMRRSAMLSRLIGSGDGEIRPIDKASIARDNRPIG